ncbi:toll-like receptor 8 [Callorhinchus milii]|uniref:toll-like receptor 8 n=1 Tax=Callorhinchus milii TaxID=7868 RepID=UPI001C3FF530|nr:toll-like receptor 8 [Callorhinchus milii]
MVLTEQPQKLAKEFSQRLAMDAVLAGRIQLKFCGPQALALANLPTPWESVVYIAKCERRLIAKKQKKFYGLPVSQQIEYKFFTYKSLCSFAKRRSAPSQTTFYFLLLLNFALTLFPPSSLPRSLPCDALNNSIIQLDCSNRQLKQVPKNIPSKTISLNLAGNRITSISNGSFSSLQSIIVINLSSNCLSNKAKERQARCDSGMKIAVGAFFSLTKLQELYLNENTLCTVPKKLPTGLKVLGLNGNHILSITKENLHSLTNLEKLFMNQNCYYLNPCWSSISLERGTFSSVNKLEVLKLGENNLTSIPQNLPRSLKSLYLHGNRIQTIHRGEFGELVHLETLDLNGNCPRCYNAEYPCKPCPGDGSIQINSYAFEQLRKISKLNLSNNSINRIHSSWFQNMTNLKVLHLVRNFLLLDIASGDFLNYLPRLEVLDLSYNYQLKAYEKYLNLSRNFSKLVSLKKLYIKGYVFKDLTREDLKPLFSLQNLTQLNLGTNFIKQVNLTIFEAIKSLQVIGLSENRISPPSTDDDLSFGSACRDNHFALTNSELRDTRLLLEHSSNDYRSSEDQDHVGEIQKWTCASYGKILDLSRNSIFFIKPEQFVGLEDIACLNLSANVMGQALNGTEFTPLRNLKYLDMSYNRIDLAYHNAFRELEKLEVLDLSNNKHYFLVEAVTHKMGFLENLKYLKVLKLSWNRIFTLTGLILKSNSLQHLEFQGNRLDILWKDEDKRYIHLFQNLTNLTLLNLSENKLKSIPSEAYENLPKNLSFLSFSYNSLETFEWQKLQMFKNLRILDLSYNKLTTAPRKLNNCTKSLERLLLSHNSISQLPEKFLPFGMSLKYLDLSYNKIKMLNQSIFPVDGSISLKVLDLIGNPFHCSCDIVPFIVWINSCKVIIPRLATDVTCDSPEDQKGQSIIFVDQHACANNDIATLLNIVTTFIIICTMVIATTHHLFYWDVWYLYYFCTAKLKGYRALSTDDYFYDAFIAYDPSDLAVTDWVVNELRVHLEEKGERSFSLCLQERDWELGLPIVDNLSQSIHKSKKTVFVLTDNYAKSGNFKTAFYMAHQRLMDQNQDVVVLVLLESVLTNSKYLRLRKRLCKNSVLYWPQNPKAEDFFWQCLRNALATDNYGRYNTIMEST